MPRFVELLRVPENPGPVSDVLASLEALDVPDRAHELHPYLEVRVQLNEPEPGLRLRIEQALNNKPVRLARIESTSARTANANLAMEPAALDDLDSLQPDDIFKKLYRQKYGQKVPEALLGAFAEIINDASIGGTV